MSFAISRGNDKTLAEIKLSTNKDYLHGYQTQIIEYSKAERTQNLIYVFVDIGNQVRKEKLKSLYYKAKRKGAPYPELVIIDSRPKKSASTYVNESEWKFPEMSFDNLPDLDKFDLEGFSNDYIDL